MADKIVIKGGEKKDVLTFLDKEAIAETIEDVLAIKSQETIDLLRNKLDELDKVNTSVLKQSIEAPFIENEDGFVFRIIMEDYWKYVDEGVNGTLTKHGSPYSFKPNGKPIPNKAMAEFVRTKGIQWQKTATHYKNKKGVLKKRKKKLSSIEAGKQLGWAIGYRLKEKGIKPTHFFTDTITEEWEQKFIEDTSNEIARVANG